MFARWTTPEAVFQILKELSRGQPCDITGIADYAHARRRGRHPVAAAARARTSPPSSERRLFADGRFFHADGQARFIFEAPRAVPEPPDARYPFALLTGRGSSSQWHTQTRTGEVGACCASSYPREPYVEINPADARTLGIDAQRVGRRRVAPRRACARAPTRRTSCSPASSSSRCTTPTPTC